MIGEEQPASTLAFCWRIERRDGAGLALTSHDSALLREGILYRPDPGVVPSAITRTLGLEPNSGEVAGALSSAALTATDLRLGRWNGARVTLSACDWQDESQPKTLLSGELGEVALEGESFSAELRGVAWRLNESVCPSTSPECRAEFGDKACRVDLANRTTRATVIAAAGVEIELDRNVGEDVLFGRFQYMSGANCGASTIVLAVTGRVVRLRDLPRAAVEPGCAVRVRQGCDKRFATCRSRFQNAANFRGEPHLPGNDLLTRYPGA